MSGKEKKLLKQFAGIGSKHNGVLFFAVRASRFDFVEACFSVRISNRKSKWASLLEHATTVYGETGETFKRILAHVKDFLPQCWINASVMRGKMVSKYFEPASLKYVDYDTLPNYQLVVQSIIRTHRNDLWDRLLPEDLALLHSATMFTRAYQSDNRYVADYLRNIIALR